MINYYVQEALHFSNSQQSLSKNVTNTPGESLKKLEYGGPVSKRQIINSELASALNSLPMFFGKRRKK